MSHSQSDSFFCVRIKRITHLQQETFLSSESYVRVRFEDKKTKRKTSNGTMQGSKGYFWDESLTFPVKRDSISTEYIYLELKRRLRFSQSSVLGSAKVNLSRLRGYMGTKDTAVLKDKYGQPVGTIHYDISLRPDTVSSIASYAITNSRQSSMQNSIPGSILGSVPGSVQSSAHDSLQGSVHGSVPGSVRGSARGATQGSRQGAKFGGYPLSVQDEGSSRSHQSSQSQGSKDLTGARVYGQQQMSYLQPNRGMMGRPYIPAVRPSSSTVSPQAMGPPPQ